MSPGSSILAVRPAWRTGEWTTALISGLVLGARRLRRLRPDQPRDLKVWSLKITLADMAWGAIASGAAATAGFFASRLVGR